MFYYLAEGRPAASFLPDLPLQAIPPQAPSLFLSRWDPVLGPAALRLTDPRQLTGTPPDVAWLDPSRLCPGPEPIPPSDAAAAVQGLTAVNLGHPRWREALAFSAPRPQKKRVHLLAVGDVGGTLLTALKMLGGDVISTIGIRDLNEAAVARWTAELGQIAWPWNYDALPEVETVAQEDLFACDVFIFAATKAVPPVDSGVSDVRMAQYEANRPLVESFARQARAARFRGLFIVLSDPVDPLCRAAFLASNRAEDGAWDGLGLLPE